MSTVGKQVVQYGLTEVYTASEPLVDVVFVHGLNGHPRDTWSTTKPDVFWPADLLPAALEEQRPRILTYGYDATVAAFTDGVSKDKIHDHAEHLASRLVANRALNKAQERPIIFVCHSLGGLVVKRCLIYCQSIRHHQHTERLRSIYVSTYGILFMGTPHNGSNLAKWGSLLQKICATAFPKKFLDSSPQLVQALQANNETLQNINRLFIEMIGRFHIYFFYESKPTDLKGTREFVVEEDSAAPLIEGVERMGIEKDHSHMCKFQDESSPGYDVVAASIQRYASDSPSLIQSRWDEERRMADLQRQAAARELLGDSIFQMGASPSGTVTPTSTFQGTNQSLLLNGSTRSVQLDELSLSSSSGLLLVAPVGFRPNSVFFGFEMELDGLTQKLGNEKRRALGTCAALLWGPPGCGKSQIAREYLWQHRNNYPAGSFWVDCKTRESRSKSFWEIGQAVAILGIDQPRDPAWDESTKFVDAVRRWFEAREGWLLVFDGVTTDNDDDIQAFVPFIPDRPGNNIIYTSVDRTLANRQRLLNPTGIKVSRLSQREACGFLYKSLGIKEPSPLQEKKAVQLVNHYECLPLAIHAAAHALIARGTSLEKFNPGTSDHRLAEPFLDILSALRDHSHPEAINLVTLLSFFAHTVPVALIRFGQQAFLDAGVEMRSVERVGSMKKELDNTIAVLIRYGLVERTLLEYSVASPNTSSSPEEHRSQRAGTTSTTEGSAMQEPLLERDDSKSLDALPESRPDSKFERSSTQSVTYSIDILRIHSVVQGVLRDELKFRCADQPEQYWWWLTVASKLLCQSYAVADGKIRSSEGRGLVRDYRDYETQAARLWSHFPKSATDAPPALRKARHLLHETIRAIKRQIQDQSPSQSFDSIKHRVQASVFERANSTSSDSPESDSGLTRTSTWTLEQVNTQTESPTQMHHTLDYDDAGSEGSWTDRWSEAGIANSRVLAASNSQSRRPSDSGIYETTPTEARTTESQRSSILQAIFQGHPVPPRKQKDLGEWKPLPAPPSLSNDQAHVRSRASSFTSTNEDQIMRPRSSSSEASAALAAVHRASPPPSRGGKIKASSRPHSLERSTSDHGRQPLTLRSPNQRLSPLATEFEPGSILQALNAPDEPRKHSRRLSSSPRLVQTALNNQAARMVPSLPIEENISITRRIGMVDSSLSNTAYAPGIMGERLTTRAIPSGYTSQPMSRQVSGESDASLATAPPAIPGSASLSVSPQIREPYLYSRPGLASIDLAAANSWHEGLEGPRGRVGATASGSTSVSSGPVFEDDTSHGLQPRLERSGTVQFGQLSPVEIEQAWARAASARGRSVGRKEEE
ncbi:hypothetical protein A1O3_05592 [Capronia epimyces CBS 606.96]|uniref:DUF676 domain-containing protein n=1 Tax=Capronia epimyces CBS 606.96 TaxID=1182542 RepID=W9XWJ2_9EURO|nr:uncharacterized protein A1O3_05592 [Capronia epimyces CBS 606.96]EXJ84917.1 hypothetical protein A1O3_05592 [Capronia epimyces CBS 606.96]